MEIVCVTKGTLELGVGQELYHMETGDIGVVFPDVIHHYQVFSSEVNEAVLINAPQMILVDLKMYCGIRHHNILL